MCDFKSFYHFFKMPPTLPESSPAHLGGFEFAHHARASCVSRILERDWLPNGS